MPELKEDQKVYVSYPDEKGNHTTTIAKLRKKWKEETENWQYNFFENLRISGVAYSNYAKYKLIKTDE